MTFNIWIALTGLAGICINVYSLTQNSDRYLRALIGAGFVMWAINNTMLHAYSAAILCAIAVGRQIIASVMPDEIGATTRAALCAFFVTAILGASLWTQNGLGTAFACTSALLSTVAMFYLHGPRLRFTLGIAYVFWCATTLCFHAWYGLASNIVLAIAAFHAFYRLQRHQQETSFEHLLAEVDELSAVSETTPAAA